MIMKQHNNNNSSHNNNNNNNNDSGIAPDMPHCQEISEWTLRWQTIMNFISASEYRPWQITREKRT